MSVLISLIIPVYNTANYVGRCIESVLSQKYSNWECICVDDGSTDNSAQILDHYAAYDSRVKVIHQKNSGVSATRNRGIRAATGDYIAFIDSDDVLSPVMLDRMVEAASKDDSDIIVSGYWDCDADENKLLYHRPFKSCIFPQQKQKVTSIHVDQIQSAAWAKLYKRSLVDRHSLFFDEDSFYGEDLIFVFKCMLYARNITCVDEGLYLYCQREGSCMYAVSGCKLDINRYRRIVQSFLRVYQFMAKNDIAVPREQRYALAFLRVAGSCKVVWTAFRNQTCFRRIRSCFLIAETMLKALLKIPLTQFIKIIRAVFRLRSIRCNYVGKCIDSQNMGM